MACTSTSRGWKTCLDLPRQPFSVNWKYVAAALCQSQLQVHATGLNEVSASSRGRMRRAPGGQDQPQLLLEPARRIACRPHRGHPTEAIAALRWTTPRLRACVGVFISRHRPHVVGRARFVDHPRLFEGRTGAANDGLPQLLLAGSNTDERGYAQLAANAAQCRLIERERSPALTLDPLLRIRRSAVPTDYFFYLDEGRNEARGRCRERRAGPVHRLRRRPDFLSDARVPCGFGLPPHTRRRALHCSRSRSMRPASIGLPVWAVLGKAGRGSLRSTRGAPWDEHRKRRRRLIRAECRG